MISPEIKVLPDPAEVAHEGARRFVELSEAAIELTGRFSVALAGGSTPRAMYELLASPQYQTQIDWPNIDVFFGDERCVPPDDPQLLADALVKLLADRAWAEQMGAEGRRRALVRDPVAEYDAGTARLAAWINGSGSG